MRLARSSFRKNFHVFQSLNRRLCTAIYSQSFLHSYSVQPTRRNSMRNYRKICPFFCWLRRRKGEILFCDFCLLFSLFHIHLFRFLIMSLMKMKHYLPTGKNIYLFCCLNLIIVEVLSLEKLNQWSYFKIKKMIFLIYQY